MLIKYYDMSFCHLSTNKTLIPYSKDNKHNEQLQRPYFVLLPNNEIFVIEKMPISLLLKAFTVYLLYNKKATWHESCLKSKAYHIGFLLSNWHPLI